jgi:hypothetical protein
MPVAQPAQGCCDRCSGEGGTSAAAMVARRRLLKAAVFRSAGAPGSADPPIARLPCPAPAHDGGGQSATASFATAPFGTAPVTAATATPAPGAVEAAGAAGAAGLAAGPAAASAGRPAASGFADTAQLPRIVSGTVADVSPQVLVLGNGGNQQRFTLTADAIAWRGAQLEPAALRQGDHVVVRLHPSSRQVADRVWANIGRVTGVIVERSGGTLVVDEGATRQPRVVVIRPRAAGRIQVRFPTLEPGYLVDIIGLRRGDELDGMIPATSQPAYPASRLPTPPLVSGHVPDCITGSATWHEPRDEPPGVLGICYPALDPDTHCAEDAVNGHSRGFARMPYLAIGSVLRVRNDCTQAECLLPVTGCAPIARLFNDRCVTCGTSPRGRIADLTLASFVALGGELERGCFNATITIGE